MKTAEFGGNQTARIGATACGEESNHPSAVAAAFVFLGFFPTSVNAAALI